MELQRSLSQNVCISLVCVWLCVLVCVYLLNPMKRSESYGDADVRLQMEEPCGTTDALVILKACDKF